MENRPGLRVWDYSDSHGGRAGNLQSSNWPAARSALNLAIDLWVSVAISPLRGQTFPRQPRDCACGYLLQQEYWLPGRRVAKLTFPLLWSLSLSLRSGDSSGILHKKGSQEWEEMRIHDWRGWGREGSNRERKSQFPLPSTCLLETVYRDCLLLPLSALWDRPHLNTNVTNTKTALIIGLQWQNLATLNGLPPSLLLRRELGRVKDLRSQIPLFLWIQIYLTIALPVVLLPVPQG